MSGKATVERRAMTKAAWRILPPLGIGYFLAFIDRVNVSFAALQMNAELGFSATIYGFGAGLFFLGYALFALPSNFMLVKFGARRWLALITVLWGLLAVSLMFVRTPTEFYVLRFLLGVAEAGYLPGVTIFIASWFPLRHRGRAMSRFYVMGSVASLLMGPIAGGLLALDGHHDLSGWQWLFLITGCPAVLLGATILWVLPSRPADVQWLSDEERSWLVGELAREASSVKQYDVQAGRGTFLRHFSNPAILLIGLLGLFSMGAYLTLTLSLPLLVREMTGLDPFQIGLITSVGGALAVVSVLLSGIIIDRMGERFTLLLVCSALVTGSYLTMALAFGQSATVVIGAYLVLAFTWAALASSSAVLATDLLHPDERPLGVGVVQFLGQIGAFCGPLVWGALRDATGSFRIGLFCLVIASGLSALSLFTLYHRTRRSNALSGAVLNARGT